MRRASRTSSPFVWWGRFLVGRTAAAPRGFDRVREQPTLSRVVPEEERASAKGPRRGRRPTPVREAAAREEERFA